MFTSLVTIKNYRLIISVITLICIILMTIIWRTNLISLQCFLKPNNNLKYSKQNSMDCENPRDANLIFVGGHQSTGTGLMRILLDIHSMVRCGPEPVITLDMLNYLISKDGRSTILNSKGITQNVLNEAAASFILSVIVNMGPYAPRLCHKEPLTYYLLKTLGDLFRKSKFIHMIRDGRGTLASTLTRGFDLSYKKDDLVSALRQWEEHTTQMINDCEYLGARCLTVRYECLVINPRQQLERILHFLDLPWEENLMKHEKLVPEISQLSNFEPSSVQILKPIHRNSLSAWTTNYSVVPLNAMVNLTANNKLLKNLGYLTDEIPPNYQSICNNLPVNQLY